MKENECIEEKKQFYKYIKNLAYLIIVIVLVYVFLQREKSRVGNIVAAFDNKQELICGEKIVSSVKGYKYYKKDSNLITNGDNMYDLAKCIIKE